MYRACVPVLSLSNQYLTKYKFTIINFIQFVELVVATPLFALKLLLRNNNRNKVKAQIANKQ